MTPLPSEPEVGYVGIAECGCVRAAVVDDPNSKKRVGKACAEFVSDGLRLERRTIESVRVAQWRCPKCEPEYFAKQQTLDLGAA